MIKPAIPPLSPKGTRPSTCQGFIFQLLFFGTATATPLCLSGQGSRVLCLRSLKIGVCFTQECCGGPRGSQFHSQSPSFLILPGPIQPGRKLASLSKGCVPEAVSPVVLAQRRLSLKSGVCKRAENEGTRPAPGAKARIWCGKIS